MQPHPPDATVSDLTVDESLRLLATRRVGRLGVVSEGRPQIFPVNYALDEDRCVVFSTTAGTKLAATVNRNVTFEVDRIDDEMHTGWSVVVHGVAHATATVAAGPRPLETWVPGRRQLVRISRTVVTGRVVGPRPAELLDPPGPVTSSDLLGPNASARPPRGGPTLEP